MSADAEKICNLLETNVTSFLAKKKPMCFLAKKQITYIRFCFRI